MILMLCSLLKSEFVYILMKIFFFLSTEKKNCNAELLFFFLVVFFFGFFSFGVESDASCVA